MDVHQISKYCICWGRSTVMDGYCLQFNYSSTIVTVSFFDILWRSCSFRGLTASPFRKRPPTNPVNSYCIYPRGVSGHRPITNALSKFIYFHRVSFWPYYLQKLGCHHLLCQTTSLQSLNVSVTFQVRLAGPQSSCQHRETVLLVKHRFSSHHYCQ